MQKVRAQIFVPGGIVSPGELRKIVNTAHHLHASCIHIGNRQELIISVEQKYEEILSQRFTHGQYAFAVGSTDLNNITCSFVTSDIVESFPWLTEGVYLEILSEFSYKPKLKINIADPNQSFVPLFTGNLNFIASEFSNYWYLFLKLPGMKKMEMWPVLIDTNEVSTIAQVLEDAVTKMNKVSLPQLETFVYNFRSWKFRIIEKALNFPVYDPLPYEGFHKSGDKYWLGIYHSNNSFPLKFIENLCLLCHQTNIGSICLTPWNSLLIKNINPKDLLLWRSLLGKHGINTGHSHLELNWQYEALNYDSLQLKKYIVNKFVQKGIRTEGLIFGIEDSDCHVFSSITIKKNYTLNFGLLKLFPIYSVSHKKDFNPNQSEEVQFVDGLKSRHIPDILEYLTMLYYDSLSELQEKPSANNDKLSEKPYEERNIYQCSDCMTVYDPLYGDETANLSPGLELVHVPEDFRCPVCDASKDNFKIKTLEQLTA
ncbi:MAG: rubredoxin [Cytophagaceae bacterium]